jgi:cytochrome oxidase Cu insertion factor (SCO1/SenC/PrrC family)
MERRRKMKGLLASCAFLMAIVFAGVVARAEDTQIPLAYRNVGVDEHLNLQLPLDARLYDENGQYTSLSAVLHPNRPILLQLGYLGCPMLCDAISHSLVDAAKQLDLTIGKDFDFVFVSIDPTDTPALATLKRNRNMVSRTRLVDFIFWWASRKKLTRSRRRWDSDIRTRRTGNLPIRRW